MEVEKINPHDSNDVGVVYLYAQRYEDVIKVLRSDNNNYYSLDWLGQVYHRMKKIAYFC